jgi:uncharacterized protein (DUF1501 family)
MREIDRRGFLREGSTALIGLALPASPRPPVDPSARPIVVCVFLRGGVDGLSMIVPHGDPLYFRARPRTAIPATDVIDLDGYFGLHPGLTPLKTFWDQGRLTVIPAAGYPELTRSHVDAQDRIGAVLARCGAIALGTLHDAARLIEARVGPDVMVVNVGGWDTHVNQGSSAGQLATRLRRLGLEIAAFAESLGQRRRDVSLLTISEFGRTIGENRNGGTDHGHATAMLVLGGAMRGGGVRGRWPGLGGPELPVTTDVRHLFGEILTRQLH